MICKYPSGVRSAAAPSFEELQRRAAKYNMELLTWKPNNLDYRLFRIRLILQGSPIMTASMTYGHIMAFLNGFETAIMTQTKANIPTISRSCQDQHDLAT